MKIRNMRFARVFSLAILALLFISEGVNAQAETVVRKDSNGDPVEEDGDGDGKGGNEKRECVCGHCGPGLLEDHHWCSYHRECLSNLCEGWVSSLFLFIISSLYLV